MSIHAIRSSSHRSLTVLLVMTQPEIEGNDANDLKLQSRDSQEDSKDDAQSDCSEMVGFASLR